MWILLKFRFSLKSSSLLYIQIYNLAKEKNKERTLKIMNISKKTSPSIGDVFYIY